MEISLEYINPYRYETNESGNLTLPNLSHTSYLTNIPPIENFFNPMLIQQRIAAFASLLNTHSTNTTNTYNNLKHPTTTNTQPLFIHNDLINYIFSIENTIHTMKYMLDSLIQVIHITIDRKTIIREKKMFISSIGDFIDEKNKKYSSSIMTLTTNELVLIKLINEIHNSYKHTTLTAESMFQINPVNTNEPMIYAIYAHRNDFNRKIKIHLHSYRQIFMGFRHIFLTKYTSIKTLTT